MLCNSNNDSHGVGQDTDAGCRTSECAADKELGGKPAIDSRFLTVVTTILKSGGPLGFYKGYAATFWRDVPFTTMYFPMFAKLRAACFRLADSTGPYTQLWVNLFSGTTVGCIGAVLVTPADVMKTRLQTTTKGQGEKAYKGIMDAIVPHSFFQRWSL
ncbi:unnamed protein product [Callosobruchus maculatus]|uniref:Mitochondrial carrier protein n=1 Tax=Callosobruchus maculatus TaxID=64391 RepID=A0A653BFJ9_CALMS|nr:unnamed protein product [Callosobruchus maculatus]